MSTCALCKEDKTLCDSHILPEFLYKPLYDSKHKIYRVSTGERPKRSFEQKGLREHLLCAGCEAQFSRYENYASQVLNKLDRMADSYHSKGIELSVDYKLFKLFELSILWRVGVTGLQEFRDINLGSDERRLRAMLRKEAPGETAKYGCIKSVPDSNRNIVDKLIVSNGMSKLKGVPCCSLFIPGMFCVFFLSKGDIDPALQECFLQESGSLRILLGDVGTDECLKRLAQKLCTNNPNLSELQKK